MMTFIRRALRFAKPTPIPGEPGVPDLGSGRMIAWQRYGIIALAVAGVVVAGVTVQKSKSADEPERQRKVHRITVSDREFELPVVPTKVVETVKPKPVAEIAQKPAATPAPQYIPDPKPEVIYVPVPAPEPEVPRVVKGMTSGVIVVASNSGSSAQSGGKIAASASPTVTSTGKAQGTDDDLPDAVDRTYVGKLENTDLLVTQGVPIPCTLDSAINTQLSGDVSCTVSRDVWSEDNSQVLIAKGSFANGTYQSVTSVTASRIGIVWGRIKTTDDLVATLDSPAASPQGEAGLMPDYVNHHFWAKFFGASAISIVDGALRNVGSGDNNADVIVNSAGNSGSSIVEEILRAYVMVPTTQKIHQGADLIIHLNRDISFERVQ